MNEFYLERTDGKWELVDEYVYKQWKNALHKDEQRYTGNKVARFKRSD